MTTPPRKKNLVTETKTRKQDLCGDGGEAHQDTGLMTDDSQTQQGAGTPMVNSLKPKRRTRVASWNIRTLNQTSKLAQVVKEFYNYKLDTLGVSEARWTGAGKRKLASGHTTLFSGRSDDQHTEGVALIINNRLEKALTEWTTWTKISQGQIQLNIHQIDSDCVLRTDRGCFGGKQG